MTKASENQIGVINEIGDMGLGFTYLSESDQQKINEASTNDNCKEKEQKEKK